MNQLKTEDQEKLQDEQAGQGLHTEGPISEKDEVKKAEDRTAQNQQHDVSEQEKLKDDEAGPVEDKR